MFDDATVECLFGPVLVLNVIPPALNPEVAAPLEAELPPSHLRELVCSGHFC
jgi:hypothetical protein